MVTITGNSINASGLGQNAKEPYLKTKSWADREEEFYSNLKEENAFSQQDGTRFFVIKKERE